MSTTVYIDQDYLTLGPSATQEDLDRYAANLETHLSERFDCEIEVKTCLGGKQCGSKCPTNDEIDEYVRELEAGDGWVDLLDE